MLAVDTKDRYTKRHSEDVARYAIFIAERLALDDERRVRFRLRDSCTTREIGIPDDILRKPAS